ncbi:MAG TPA: thiamine diphosphokinase, partial [Chloroflexota bacterium]|nr:thiamine diphosphokinase [Chloroflexota bacterium]
MSRALIFAGGDAPDAEVVKSNVRPDDLVIAADGGLAGVLGCGVNPNVIIGDLDSAPSELVQLAKMRGAEVMDFPTRKDRTDLELALILTEERGIAEIVIFGGLGGRLDHAVANLLLITGHSQALVRLVSSDSEVMTVRGRTVVRGQAGDTVTLLAVSERATGVQTEGLEYALRNGVLTRGSTLGVSNVMTGEEASVT